MKCLCVRCDDCGGKGHIMVDTNSYPATREEIATAIGLVAYADATRLAIKCNQCVGELSEYYVTLRQLEQIFLDIRRGYTERSQPSGPAPVVEPTSE
jgi:hypothetical protein